ncbi:hypothetical protein GCM10007979_14980 [Nocardioides albus]|nr:hypothetical protein GCM10007979_14980 [Nocardioides albus]
MKAVTVAPWWAPSGVLQVITVTPVAKRPKVDRRVRGSMELLLRRGRACVAAVTLEATLDPDHEGGDPLGERAIRIAHRVSGRPRRGVDALLM